MALIAVLDIGKTHAKLTLIEAESGAAISTAQHPCRSVAGGAVRALDVVGIEAWLLRTLAQSSDRARIRHIMPVAHGAAVVLLDAAGDVLWAPDYEDPIFDEVIDDYLPERDPFERTLSPNLALGLNVGMVLFFLQTRQSELFERVRWILPYPQYWAWRFSRVMVSEVTSLGCHTDLWWPLEGRYSALAQRRGWLEFAAASAAGRRRARCMATPDCHVPAPGKTILHVELEPAPSIARERLHGMRRAWQEAAAVQPKQEGWDAHVGGR
jgi:L-fuculokinase